MASCNTLLFIVFHDDESKKRAERYQDQPWARLLYIESTKFLESEAYRILAEREEEWRDKTYVGVLKHSFEDKTTMFDFAALCEGSGADVLTFVGPESHSPDTQGLSMIRTARRCHMFFPTIWAHILVTRMGLEESKVFSDEIPAFYSNFWIARTHLFREFLRVYAVVRDIMERDELIRPILFMNAAYFQHIGTERLTQIMGVPFYPYHPFVMERLPCLVFWLCGAKIQHVTNDERLRIQERFFQRVYPNGFPPSRTSAKP
jgi:hypothetical protein